MVSEEAPSIVGNHMIAAIELPADYKPKDMYSIVTTTQGKRYLIFDPTWEKLPFGQLEHELQGGTALLVDGSDSQAIRLPVLRPEQNLIERKSRFQLALDGSLSGTVNEQETGEIATRQRYLSMEEEKDQRKALEQRVGHDLNAFQIADEKTMHANNLQDPMTLSYSLKAQGFAQDAGSLMMVRPRVLGEDSFWVDTKKRAVPIDLGSTREVRDDIEIALPDGVSVEELPSPVNLDVGFASYHSESKTEGRTIHYRRTYIVREIMLPPDRYADVQKLARFIHTDEQTSAVLKRN